MPSEVQYRELIKAYEKKKSLNEKKAQQTVTQSPLKDTAKVKYRKYRQGSSQPQLTAGADMTPTLEKLSEESSYTGYYRRRLEQRDRRGRLDVSGSGSGELCSSPERARSILKSTPVWDLNLPSRSGDFRTEVEWRLQLRPNLNK